jgi:hypothetical protein
VWLKPRIAKLTAVSRIAVLVGAVVSPLLARAQQLPGRTARIDFYRPHETIQSLDEAIQHSSMN